MEKNGEVRMTSTPQSPTPEADTPAKLDQDLTKQASTAAEQNLKEKED